MKQYVGILRTGEFDTRKGADRWAKPQKKHSGADRINTTQGDKAKLYAILLKIQTLASSNN